MGFVLYMTYKCPQISHLAGSATGERAWHGMGVVTDGTLPAREAFETANALFTVEKRELQYPIAVFDENRIDGLTGKNKGVFGVVRNFKGPGYPGFFLACSLYMKQSWQSTNWAPSPVRKSFGRLTQTSLCPDANFRRKQRRLKSLPIGALTSDTAISRLTLCSLTSSVTPLTDTDATPIATTSKIVAKSLATKNCVC